MRKNPILAVLAVIVCLPLLAGLVYQVPSIKSRLDWRLDLALTYVRGVIHPVGQIPTPLPQPSETLAPSPTHTIAPAVTATATELLPTSTPVPSPTPPPASISLEPPPYEKQGPNNCGPASLTMLLRYYGWQGNQEDITNVIKPFPEDRNVNVDELIYFARNKTGWLRAEFRVGGDLGLLKRLLAAGFPVTIEESFYDDQSFWPGDDRWAAHYLLLTGYDDTAQAFTGQDSYRGANQKVPYQTLDDYWQAFNRVYILVYKPEEEGTLRAILGENWDADANRQHALDVAQAETQSDPKNAFAWFNLGSNLVYFERYAEAGHAYDEARNIGLPQRMLRYQFGPFFAYFHASRNEDLMAVTSYVMKNTPNSEEALLWHGWGLYRNGDKTGAIANFRDALKAHPGYQDAQYALDFVQNNP